MPKWLEKVSQWHDMCCHDLEVMSSNPGRVELGMHSTSVLSHTLTNNIIWICKRIIPVLIHSIEGAFVLVHTSPSVFVDKQSKNVQITMRGIVQSADTCQPICKISRIKQWSVQRVMTGFLACWYMLLIGLLRPTFTCLCDMQRVGTFCAIHTKWSFFWNSCWSIIHGHLLMK